MKIKIDLDDDSLGVAEIKDRLIKLLSEKCFDDLWGGSHFPEACSKYVKGFIKTIIMDHSRLIDEMSDVLKEFLTPKISSFVYVETQTLKLKVSALENEVSELREYISKTLNSIIYF